MLIEEEADSSGKRVGSMAFNLDLELTYSQPESTLSTASMPLDIKEKLLNIKSATESLRSVYYDVSGGREQLRGAVKILSSRVSDIDSEG